MGNTHISYRINVVFSALLLLSTVIVGCDKPSIEKQDGAHYVDTVLRLDGGILRTKSENPSDEGVISDLNIFVFNSRGELDERKFLRNGQFVHHEYGADCHLKLIRGMEYSIYIMANIGYAPQLRTLEDVIGFRYWMTRPDEYRGGIPMSGHIDRKIADGKDIHVPMTRTMAKVSLGIDRSRLDDGVSFEVRSIEVGNCPRSVPMFGEGGVRDEDDIFPVGFMKYGIPTEVYLLENASPTSDDHSSYIEIKAEYKSKELYTKEGKYLTYRFRIDDGKGHSVHRNTHYKITVVPEKDGLGGVNVDNWRIDKSELSILYPGQPYLIQHPEGYVECHIGDRIHLWCDVYPPDTPFDVGREFLEDDHLEGRYDYEIDEDGFGVWLTMTEGGMGWVEMRAGEPINDGALWMIMCEP